MTFDPGDTDDDLIEVSQRALTEALRGIYAAWDGVLDDLRRGGKITREEQLQASEELKRKVLAIGAFWLPAGPTSKKPE